MAPRSKGWSDALLMIILLFTVSVSNPKQERMFSRLKNMLKHIFFAPLILRVMEVGSSWKTFDPISAINKRSIDKVRCTTKEKGSRSCKSHNSAKVNVKSLSDDDSYEEEGNISENGDKEGYLFSSDSE